MEISSCVAVMRDLAVRNQHCGRRACFINVTSKLCRCFMSLQQQTQMLIALYDHFQQVLCLLPISRKGDASLKVACIGDRRSGIETGLSSMVIVKRMLSMHWRLF